MKTVSAQQFRFSYANSNMYIIIEGRSALVIDPNISDEALDLLNSAKVEKLTILLTHEHYDHTSGLTWLASKFDSIVICQENTAASLKNGKNNRPVIIASNRMDKMSTSDIKDLVKTLPHGYHYDVDISFTDEYYFSWEGHDIRMVSCKGHSKGSCCIEIDDGVVATGDSLILNTPVITRLPGGSEEEYRTITLPYLNRIDKNTLILPGHGDTFYMKEEHNLNEKN